MGIHLNHNIMEEGLDQKGHEYVQESTQIWDCLGAQNSMDAAFWL